MNYLLDKFSKIKQLIKTLIPKSYSKEFDYSTLPWIDQEGADIDAFLKNFSQKEKPPYELAEKLEFWQKNGYVIFEKAISEDLIDKYLARC